MLKRGYMILIGGALLFVIGVTMTIVYSVGMVGTLLDETTILNNIEIEPSGSVNHTLEIESAGRPVSVALHMEPIADSNIDTSNPSLSQRSTLDQLVISPDGVVINKNQLGESTQRDLLTSFMPQIKGI
jgi:hypothetical protein